MPAAGAKRDTPILSELRARIARLEDGGARDREETAIAPVPLGHVALDATLGGGIARAALHEIRASEADGALAFGFAAALTARLAGHEAGRDRARFDRARLDRAGPGWTGNTRSGVGWTLIVTTFDGAGEWGRPYGPGLAAFGLDPGRLLVVEARRPREALWAAEEGLSSPALAAVLTEIRGDPAVVDLTATRRLALRAARRGVTAMLVRPGTGEGLSAARTRWRISPPAEPHSGSLTLPPPAWQVDLERNATRPGGRFSLMWKPDEHLFAPVTPTPLVVTPDIAGPGVLQSGFDGPGSDGSGSDQPRSDQPGPDWPDTAVSRRQAAAPAGRAVEGSSVERPFTVPFRRTG